MELTLPLNVLEVRATGAPSAMAINYLMHHRWMWVMSLMIVAYRFWQNMDILELYSSVLPDQFTGGLVAQHLMSENNQLQSLVDIGVSVKEIPPLITEFTDNSGLLLGPISSETLDRYRQVMTFRWNIGWRLQTILRNAELSFYRILMKVAGVSWTELQEQLSVMSNESVTTCTNLLDGLCPEPIIQSVSWDRFLKLLSRLFMNIEHLLSMSPLIDGLIILRKICVNLVWYIHVQIFQPLRAILLPELWRCLSSIFINMSSAITRICSILYEVLFLGQTIAFSEMELSPIYLQEGCLGRPTPPWVMASLT
jgi:hypothetical protein